MSTTSNGFHSGQNRDLGPTDIYWFLGRVGQSSLSQGSRKSQSDARAIQDRPGFYYVDVTHGAVMGKWYVSQWNLYFPFHFPSQGIRAQWAQTQLAAKIPVRPGSDCIWFMQLNLKLRSQSCKELRGTRIWRYGIFSLFWMHFCYVSRYISHYIPIARHSSSMSMNLVICKDPRAARI